MIKGRCARKKGKGVRAEGEVTHQKEMGCLDEKISRVIPGGKDVTRQIPWDTNTQKGI